MKHLRIKTKHFQRATLTLLTLVMAFTAQTAWADYGWYDASMSIGGITTDFTKWSTSGDTPTDLGNVTDMTIESIAFKVWSDANDRGGANMFFRIWDGGESPVGDDQDLWLGSATRISGDHNFDISYSVSYNLANAVNLPLVPGKTYYIDMWAKTYGDAGDEWYSAGGANYHAKLTYGTSISTATVTGVNASYDWTGSVIHPVPVVKLDEKVLSSTTDYDVTYSDGCTNGGNYSVTIKGKGNYAGTKVVNFSILVPTGYYLVGTMNSWELNTNFKLAQNTDKTSEYYIRNVVLSATDELKVVRTDDGKTNNEYFPSGSNYKPGKGTWDIYFRPDNLGDIGWHEGTLYASAQSSIDVALAPTGYGTYFNGQCEVTLPTGVVAYVLNEVNGTAPTYEKIADGDGDGTNVKKTVPAGVAVLLYSASKPEKVTLNLNTATSDSRTFTSNKLYGSDVATTTTGVGEGEKYYYKLTYEDSNKEKFGWFWGAAGGGAFTSPAHKAWLALDKPTTGSARTFLSLPGEDVTGIATIENRQQNADNVWYDLNGRRINAPTTKGIYVKDGRKFVIK